MTSRRFECTRCQRCCARPGQVEFSAPEVFLAASFLGVPPDELTEAYMHPRGSGWVIAVDEGSPCPFLGKRGCEIHPVKPSQCRTYPFWPEILDEPGAWQAEATWCEGIGRGPLYNDDAIAAILVGERDTFENDADVG
ncbi:YkgJ family cysteine cluster protein [Lujinxingia vulgaris]|uniref:YkgJ family cysteine cluster protein n=1 Tax=Lujinxingia vulgaris TaxID=2600176 RepID=A0A5C6X967_9DELT|nr:YkgJ family cysteine cluster protein [Lujinxingia vulgaris]TXD35724.1 YkgJ family cysteine cluster protein [Lujinxingia vulgaris]